VEPVTVAKVREIPPGGAKVVVVAGRPVAVFNVGGTFHATDNTCLHRGGPVGEGFLEGSLVTCPWHGWQYDVTSGAIQHMPGRHVGAHRVRIDNGEVKVAID